MCDICCLTCLIHVMERIHCCMKVTLYILWCFNIARKLSLLEDMKTVFFMWKLYFSNRNHCKKTWKPSTKIQFVGGKLIPQAVFLWNFVQYSLIFNLACFVLFHALPQWHFLLSPHILYSLFVYLCQHRGSRSPAKLDTISERTKRRRPSVIEEKHGIKQSMPSWKWDIIIAVLHKISQKYSLWN